MRKIAVVIAASDKWNKVLEVFRQKVFKPMKEHWDKNREHSVKNNAIGSFELGKLAFWAELKQEKLNSAPLFTQAGKL